MTKNQFLSLILIVLLFSSCNAKENNESSSMPEASSVPTVDYSDDPAFIAQKGIENRCRSLSEGYLEVVNFQKLDGVRAKDLRGIETYGMKCSYQVKGMKNGGYLKQCAESPNLMGVKVGFSPNRDDCFNYPVVEGQIYYLDDVDISTYTPNFTVSLEKHDNGWVFAKKGQ